jgi:hypothetical protein
LARGDFSWALAGYDRIADDSQAIGLLNLTSGNRDRVFAEAGVVLRRRAEATLAPAFVEAGTGIAIVDPLSAASAAARVIVKRFAPALAESL